MTDNDRPRYIIIKKEQGLSNILRTRLFALGKKTQDTETVFNLDYCKNVATSTFRSPTNAALATANTIPEKRVNKSRQIRGNVINTSEGPRLRDNEEQK
ncbi:hypothetical protein TNCV_4136841 [Trichonephila clavipes]|nr:hypothetical protein TNCV_4136841 [Trichonephila clavipes]